MKKPISVYLNLIRDNGPCNNLTNKKLVRNNEWYPAIVTVSNQQLVRFNVTRLCLLPKTAECFYKNTVNTTGPKTFSSADYIV